MTAMDKDTALPALLEVPQPADPADVEESYGVGFATGYNQAIVESRAAMERFALSVARAELADIFNAVGVSRAYGLEKISDRMKELDDAISN